MQRIYLDNNATSPLRAEIAEAMQPYLSGWCGNASSLHREGRLARRAVDRARDRVATLLDAEPEQIIFTSGGTEANNLAVLGLAGAGRPLVTSTIEHPSVLGCFERLERRDYELRHLAVDADGIVDAIAFASLLADARLASTMLANNETGAIQPIEQLAAAARQQGVLFHTDAVQAVGRIPVSFRSLGVDALSLSAHKFHGPLGVGVLVVRRRELLAPVLTGGHQEMGYRPGTEPVPLVVGLTRALELALQELDSNATRMRELRDHFELELGRRCGAVRNGPSTERLPNTANLRFPDIDAQAAVLALDLQGLACSTGSACSSGAQTPSHVLLAMGLDDNQARSSIRFSLSALTTREEIDAAVEHVARVVTSRTTRRNESPQRVG